jgi:membrane-associated PAP2 superfamily phosphatase
MTIFLLWPRGAKTILIVSGAALVGFNLYAFAHYDLRHRTPAIRLYCMNNGLGMGIAVASVASLRRKDKALEDRTA